MGEGGGVAGIYSQALFNTRLLPVDLNVSTFEYMEVVKHKNCSVVRLALFYHPGHPGMDRIFMEEFDSFSESFLSINGKLLIFGDFNYWVDGLVLKPHSSEFLEL